MPAVMATKQLEALENEVVCNDYLALTVNGLEPSQSCYEKSEARDIVTKYS